MTLDNQQELTEQLKNYNGPDAVITSADHLDIIHASKETEKEFFFTSGIPHLDELITGFYGGELTVISGKTKHGKTLLAQTITNNLTMTDIVPNWFTYEVRIKQFCEQFGETCPVFLAPKTLKQNDTRWLEHRIFEGILKFKSKAFFIDNTHNILNLTGDNLVHRVDEFIKRLKEICVKYNVHGFLLHHMMKGEVHRVDDLDDNCLRDSSMIGQTADNLIFVWRDDQGAWCVVDLNRRNGVFKKKFRLEKVGHFFREVSELPIEGQRRPPRRQRRVDIDEP
jgi:replicative DNA helicase